MRKKFLLVFLFIFSIFCLLWFGDCFPAAKKGSVPEKIPVLSQEKPAIEEEYELLFNGTGLGRQAILYLQENSEDINEALRVFHEQLKKPLHVEHVFMFFPTTKAELLADSKGRERRLVLPAVQAGDILLTKSTKTLSFRHGHAALVLDDEGTTLESFMLGVPSDVLSVDSWSRYSTLMILRPKAECKDKIEDAVSFAQENLVDVPYNIFTGVLKKDKSKTGVDSTHCAHLVWQAYYQAGLDLDFDGGWMVTPHDIAKSPALEVIFSYGF